MKKLFYLLLILSPFALNAMQRATILGEPIRHRGIHPVTKVAYTVTTIQVTDANDLDALEKLINNDPSLKQYVERISKTPVGKQMLITSALTKPQIQNIINKLNATPRAQVAAPAAPAAVKQAPAPAAVPPVRVQSAPVAPTPVRLQPAPTLALAPAPQGTPAKMISATNLSQEAQDFLTKKNINPPYTIYKMLQIPETSTYEKIKAAFEEAMDTLDTIINTSNPTEQNKKILIELRQLILNKYDEYKQANPY